MPRTPSAPTSRNVHHSNLKTKQGKTFVAPSPHNGQVFTQTRSSRRERQIMEPKDDTVVIVAQPPKKVKKNPKLETHFTIPNIQVLV